jgi:predicted GNAT family N-acyltransferase
MPLASRFRVEPADYRTDLEALRAVREPVFVAEQQVPIEEEWDALDPHCHHVIARDEAGRPIGTGRLTPEHKIGRMAVLAEWRGQGVGDALLVALIDEARRRGWPTVSLNAQVQAAGFYARHGFAPYGEEFMEAGIRHQAMRRALEPVEGPARPGPDRPALEPLHEVEDLAGGVAALRALIPLARRELVVVTRELDPPLLGHPDVLEALRRFATSVRGAEVRIVLLAPAAAQAAHHPLLGLAQRLSSVFQIRTPLETHDQHLASAWVASDRGGVYYRPIGSRVEGEASACHPPRARQLMAEFEPVWERSRPASELRALGI